MAVLKTKDGSWRTGILKAKDENGNWVIAEDPRLEEKTEAAYNAGYQKGKDEGGDNSEWWNEYLINRETGSEKTYFLCAFAGQGWNKDTFKPTKNLKPTNALQMFFHFNELNGDNSAIDLVAHLENLGIELDFSGCKNANYCFAYANISHIGEVDLQECTDVTCIFAQTQYNHPLITIDKIKVSSKTNITTNMFVWCASLENITFEGEICNSIGFANSSSLTTESILSIFRALKKYASTDTGYLKNTLTLNAAAKTTINTAYPNGTEDMPLADGETWEDYALSIGWNM